MNDSDPRIVVALCLVLTCFSALISAYCNTDGGPKGINTSVLSIGRRELTGARHSDSGRRWL